MDDTLLTMNTTKSQAKCPMLLDMGLKLRSFHAFQMKMSQTQLPFLLYLDKHGERCMISAVHMS